MEDKKKDGIMHKAIRCVLRFVIRHNELCSFLEQFDWFNRIVEKEAHIVLRNLK